MISQYTVRGERSRAPVPTSQGLRRAANAVFHHLIDAQDKAQIFAAVRAGAAGRANAAQHRKLLAERARLIPTFHVFRALVLEDLRAAYSEDRLEKTRGAKNRRSSWIALYKPFAALRGMEKALLIRALDRSGNYECELVERKAPERWARFIELGAGYGIAEAELSALYERAQAPSQKRA